MRRVRQIADFLCVILLVFLPAPLLARSLSLESFHSDISVPQDRSIVITETLRPRFEGSWNGIYRLIPIRYRTPRDEDFRLDLVVLSVTDGNHQPLRYETSTEGHYRKIKIWIPDARDATKTVVLRYRTNDAVQFYEEYDEIYWNVTGDGWEIPIHNASATLYLPDQISGLRTAAYTGAYGSREQAVRIVEEGTTINYFATRPLGIHEGLTIAAAWDPGVVQRPTSAEKLAGFLKRNLVFLIPILIFGLMYWLWSKRGRDPDRRPIVAQYQPPEEMTPAELGTLVDHYPHTRDLSATLVNLAVRGYIRIEETEKEMIFGLLSSQSYEFVSLRDRQQWAGLKSHEQKFLDALFPNQSTRTSISDLKNRFYKKLPGIHDAIFASLMKANYYQNRPDKMKKRYLVVAVILGFLAFFAGGFMLAAQGGARLIIAGLLSAAVVGVFAFIMPARTAAGTRVLEHVLGFEEFLDRVESDRYRRMITGPEMFERYLPYAMALGVEENWATAFHDIYHREPDWYQSRTGGGFRPLDLTRNIQTMSSVTTGAMASQPRSSGGSSFSGGGGFSGGGFGGGGGGGF